MTPNAPAPEPRRLLILFAHPAPHASRANAVLAARVRALPRVTFHDLYAAYPDFFIDTAREHALLESHDVIIAQHPLYWHSVPSLLKEWMDSVLAYGWAYGAGGTRLAGKAWGHALTAGWPEEAYTPEGGKRYTLTELLRPLERTAAVCGMRWLPPFVVHRARSLSGQALAERAERYAAWIERLGEGRLPS